jgi:hypothetical protein
MLVPWKWSGDQQPFKIIYLFVCLFRRESQNHQNPWSGLTMESFVRCKNKTVGSAGSDWPWRILVLYSMMLCTPKSFREPSQKEFLTFIGFQGVVRISIPHYFIWLILCDKQNRGVRYCLWLQGCLSVVTGRNWALIHPVLHQSCVLELSQEMLSATVKYLLSQKFYISYTFCMLSSPTTINISQRMYKNH